MSSHTWRKSSELGRGEEGWCSCVLGGHKDMTAIKNEEMFDFSIRLKIFSGIHCIFLPSTQSRNIWQASHVVLFPPSSRDNWQAFYVILYPSSFKPMYCSLAKPFRLSLSILVTIWLGYSWQAPTRAIFFLLDLSISRMGRRCDA